MWPLFIYAAASTEQEGAALAAEKLRQIRNPVCRTDSLLTSFKYSLKSRGNSRYFSAEKFEIAPPFI
ncbi:hypothetical protein V1527DRAFT_479003 [Lipomyces starkeyi]